MDGWIGLESRRRAGVNVGKKDDDERGFWFWLG